MNTIKIYLAESGRIADLKKDFPLYQYQFQNKLLNIFVPTSILAPDFKSQSATGEVQADYVAGTSVKIGMSYTARDGSIKVSKNYYMRYLKTLTYQNVEYALYERKLPKEFTNYAGQGANAPILTVNVVNVQEQSEGGTPIILSVTATQTCSLDVMKSTSLDNDEAVEPTELENINAEINSINAILPTKQDKVDENLTTTNKSVVGAINENKSRIDVNTTNIQTNTQNISRNRSDIDLLIARMKLSEDYIGQLTGTELPSNSELNAFVKANTSPSRDPRNGDVIIFIQQIEGATDKNYKYFYSQMDWQHYEIPPIESASNGTLGLVRGTYIIGKPVDNVNTTLVDIIDGEIVNIYVADKTGTLRNIVEYLNSNSATIKELETADTQNVKLTGDQSVQGVKNFVGTLQVTGAITDGTNTTTIASIPVEIETTVDPTNYVMTTNLKNASGTVVSTGTVDLPLESVVVGGEYNAETKQVVLTLQNGNTIEFSVADLVSGLVSQTDFDNIVNNTTKIADATYGGFAGGKGSSATNGGAVGLNAKTQVGGAVGRDANSMNGGAVGVTSYTVSGGAVGNTAYSLSGGAVGFNAKTSAGFAGGYDAKAVDLDGNGIDAIQLGTGTNTNPKTLQVYDDNIYNANTHTLTVTGAITDGTNSITIADIVNKSSKINLGFSEFVQLPDLMPNTDYWKAKTVDDEQMIGILNIETGAGRTIDLSKDSISLGVTNEDDPNLYCNISLGSNGIELTSTRRRGDVFDTNTIQVTPDRAILNHSNIATQEYVDNLIGGVSAVLGNTEDLGV